MMKKRKFLLTGLIGVAAAVLLAPGAAVADSTDTLEEIGTTQSSPDEAFVSDGYTFASEDELVALIGDQSSAEIDAIEDSSKPKTILVDPTTNEVVAASFAQPTAEDSGAVTPFAIGIALCSSGNYASITNSTGSKTCFSGTGSRGGPWNSITRAYGGGSGDFGVRFVAPGSSILQTRPVPAGTSVVFQSAYGYATVKVESVYRF